MDTSQELERVTWPNLDELKFSRLKQHAPTAELESAFGRLTGDLDAAWAQALQRIIHEQEQLNRKHAQLTAMAQATQRQATKATQSVGLDVSEEVQDQVTGCYSTMQRIQALFLSIDSQLPETHKLAQYPHLAQRMHQPLDTIHPGPGKRPLRPRQSSSQLRVPRLRTVPPVPALPGHALPVAERDSVSIRTSIVSRSVFSIRRFFGRGTPATAETQLRRVSEQQL